MVDSLSGEPSAPPRRPPGGPPGRGRRPFRTDFQELDNYADREGGGETLFSGTTDEPASVTVDGTDAILGNGGQSFAATVDLPTDPEKSVSPRILARMKEGKARNPTALTDFQLDVEMRNNADTERLRLEQAKVTGVAEPRTAITEATFNELNQLVSRGGGGETLFSGTTDEPATVTVDGTDAILGNDGQSFAATVDLPTGTSTVTVEATDVNSNTTSEDYEVEVAAGSGQSLTYDANGNMTDNGSGQTYKWDAEDRLIEITRGTETTEFAYDGMSRRVRITEKSSGVTVEDRHYIWDGAEIVERRAANGTTWEQRYYAEGFVDATEGDFFYTRDHLGSIREVVADDGVTVESQYDYGIWGEVERIAGAGEESSFRYTGHFYHAPSELHLTWFRAYDADLGRWLSRDPIGIIDGPNLYGYVNNNPAISWDPFGLETCIVVGMGTESNPFGHVGMGIEGEGAFSFGTGAPQGSSFTDYLSSQSSYRNSIVYVLPTTPEQEQSIKKYLESLEDKPLPDPYEDLKGAWKDNCVTRSNDALKEGGLDLGNNNIPAELQRKLERMVKGGEATKFLVPQGSDPHSAWSVFNPQ